MLISCLGWWAMGKLCKDRAPCFGIVHPLVCNRPSAHIPAVGLKKVLCEVHPASLMASAMLSQQGRTWSCPWATHQPMVHQSVVRQALTNCPLVNGVRIDGAPLPTNQWHQGW